MTLDRIKIRFRTWYWGQFVYEGDCGFSIAQEGFDLYDEERHGWHRSEEARRC